MRPEKIAIVDMLTEKLHGISSFILADYRGLKVQEMNELRKALLEDESELMVVPNRMLKLALGNVELGMLDEYIVGPTAVVLGGQDAVKVAKVLYGFSRVHKGLRLKGGYFDNLPMSGDQVEEIAKLPTRRELLASLVGQFDGLLSGLLLVLIGPARGFITILGKIGEAKEE